MSCGMLEGGRGGRSNASRGEPAGCRLDSSQCARSRLAFYRIIVHETVESGASLLAPNCPSATRLLRPWPLADEALRSMPWPLAVNTHTDGPTYCFRTNPDGEDRAASSRPLRSWSLGWRSSSQRAGITLPSAQAVSHRKRTELYEANASRSPTRCSGRRMHLFPPFAGSLQLAAAVSEDRRATASALVGRGNVTDRRTDTSNI